MRKRGTKQLVTKIAFCYDVLLIFGTRINRIHNTMPSFWTRIESILHRMYPKPQENETTGIDEFVHNKQEAFQRAVERV